MKTAIPYFVLAIGGVTVMMLCAVIQLTTRAEGDRVQQLKTNSIEMQRLGSQVMESEVDRWSSVLSSMIGSNENQDRFVAWGTLKESHTVQNKFEFDRIQTASGIFTEESLSEKLKELSLADVSKYDRYWARILSPDQRTYLLFIEKIQIQYLSQLKEKYVFGVLPGDIFTKMNLVSKGMSDLFFIVNSMGYTVSYPDAQYVGSKFENHPLVDIITQNQGVERSPEKLKVSGIDTVGGFLQVSGTNLFVVTSSPVWANQQANLAYYSEVAIHYLVIFAVLGILFYFLGQYNQKTIGILRKNYELIVSQLGESTSPAPSSEEGAPDKSGMAVRVQVDGFAAALARLLREPTIALIGHLQSLEAKAKTNDFREKVSRAQGEARKIKEFVDVTEGRAIGVRRQDEEIDLEATLTRTVQSQKPRFIENGVVVQAEIGSDVSIRGKAQELNWIASTLFDFMYEKISPTATEKLIRISLKRFSLFAEIKISANFIQLSETERKHFFEPYRIQMKNSENLNLEFALIQKFIKDVSGDISLSRAAARDFEITVLWPLLNPTATSLAASQENHTMSQQEGEVQF